MVVAVAFICNRAGPTWALLFEILLRAVLAGGKHDILGLPPS